MQIGRILVLIAVAALSGCEPPVTNSGSATVVDGDTLRIGGTTIRLHAIDAPESRQTCERAGETWQCGEAATSKLKALADGRTIACAQMDIDRYSRVVAICKAGASDLAEEMALAGLALAYRQFGNDYVREEAEARAARRGVWAGEFTAPWDWRRDPREPGPGTRSPEFAEPIVDRGLRWVRAAFGADPLYWSGVLIWGAGFLLYLWSGFVRTRPNLNLFAELFCWAGFFATLLAYSMPFFSRDATFRVPAFDFENWPNTGAVIWLISIIGSIAIVGSWIGLVGRRVGWLGLCLGMTVLVALSTGGDRERFQILGSGIAVVMVLFLFSVGRGQLSGLPSSPGDYEAELVRLCNGNRWKAAWMIRRERKKSPGLSRAGAALAAVTRIRHQRNPKPSL